LKDFLCGKATLVDGIDLVFLLIFIICLFPVWRKLPRLYGVYYITFLSLYLIRTSQIEPLLSMSRYVLVFFPAFMVLGELGRRSWLHRLILYGSWFGLLYLAGQFALWGWVG
jgi:hypothetical protein